MKTPEEVAAAHCYNGHDPARCKLLAAIRNLITAEREAIIEEVEMEQSSLTVGDKKLLAGLIRAREGQSK